MMNLQNFIMRILNMFKQPKRKILVGIVSSALFSMASVSVLAGDDDDRTYNLISGSGKPVFSGREGECVKTPVTPNDPNQPFEECGDIADWDKDGVPDKDDDCPRNTPEEISKGVDERGCPKDTDGDGVPDYRDDCPNSTPEEIAAGIDERGCPIKHPLAIRVVGSNEVFFDFDKSTLKNAGKQELDRVAADMLKHPDSDFKVVVVGHTDSIGSNSYNQNLSEKRAKSVVNYLISQGVSAAFFNPSNGRGDGENNPIADNRTKAGRAQNRRVEIDVKSSDDN